MDIVKHIKSNIMSDDTETFTRKSKRTKQKKINNDYECNGGDDFPSMLTDMFKGVPWKVSFFLFIIMIFIFSDLYIELFLSSIPDTLDGDSPTTKGTILQITTTIICYIILDLLVQGEFL